MSSTSVDGESLQGLLTTRYDELVACCRKARVPYYDDAGVAKRIQRLLLASDHAFAGFCTQPHLLAPEGLEWLLAATDAGSRASNIQLAGLDEAVAMRRLRRFRQAEALRLLFRDVNGLDDIDDTLAQTTALYEGLIESALVYAEQRIAVRHGLLRNADGQVQRLVVMALGKLGGGELNYSSDVDLVLAYAEQGRSDGPRSLQASEYYTRLGRMLVRLLDTVTAEGQVARVDLRLRPFGQAGRVAVSFAAMETYYQREGRDWERYAWIKARPVAGDCATGRRLLEMLRPFVYRRYLDYTAFDGLREMKTMIDLEVARRDRAEDLKLGPGGIREIEFMVQLEQLIRGGRDASLRVPGLLPALAACQARGFIPAARAARLAGSYRFLRRLENRVQMFADAQTHCLPESALAQERIARGLGYPGRAELMVELQEQRNQIAGIFTEVFGEQRPETVSRDRVLRRFWRAVQEGDLDLQLRRPTEIDASTVQALQALAGSLAVRTMESAARQRLERLIPQLLDAAAATPAPQVATARLLRLLQNIARRPAYLALLEESPQALQRLAMLCAKWTFLAEHVINQPLLLDDVLDPRIDWLPLKRADIAREIAHARAALAERDLETDLQSLNELRASLSFRLGMAFISQRANAVATSRRLASLAEAILGALVALAEHDLVGRHGRLPGAGLGFVVLGYGSLGGAELGFASDLDLAFIYDGDRASLQSDGPRPLEGAIWYQRLAQRVVNWLSMATSAGRLYEVDMRLRPDGSQSLLVRSLSAYAAYQNGRAWTWEHQALVRCRPVAGDAMLGARLQAVRRNVLCRQRSAVEVRSQVRAMRARWRAERDRSDTRYLDLKQGAGGLLDIEFLLQTLVLIHTAKRPELLEATASETLIDLCDQAGLLPVPGVHLRQAHAAILDRALLCTLDGRHRLVERSDAEIERLSGIVRHAVTRLDQASVF